MPARASLHRRRTKEKSLGAGSAGSSGIIITSTYLGLVREWIARSRDHSMDFALVRALGQPGPQDVGGRVEVGVVAVTTPGTSERDPDTVLCVDVSAGGARLGGVMGVDREQLDTSVFQGE